MRTVEGFSRLTRALNAPVTRDLLWVWLAAFGVRLVWAALVPPWMVPDEPQHFAYVAHLVENGEIPDVAFTDSRYPQHSLEFEQSCYLTLCSRISGLGRGYGELKYLPMNHDYAKARELRLSDEERKTSSGSTATAYSALYYALATVPYKLLNGTPILTRMLGVRALSAAFGAFACIFGYLFAYELRRDRRWGIAVALCMAFMPMYAFASAAVNNDAAMFVGTSAAYWLLARAWMASTLGPGLACAIGAVSAAAALAKPTAAPVLMLAGLMIAAKAVRSQGRWRFRWSAMRQLAGFALGLLLIHAPRVLYGLVRAQPPTAVPASYPSLSVFQILLGRAPHSFADYLRDLYARGWPYVDWLFVKTFWGTFGWLEHFMSDGTYSAINVCMAAGAAGLLLRFVRQPGERSLLTVLLLALLVNVVVLFAGADYVMSFARRGATFGMQGRYFFGTLAPFMFLLISGVATFFKDGTAFVRLTPLPMVVLHAVSLLVLIRVYYGMAIP